MTDQPPQQNVQVRIDDSQANATYANAFRQHTTGHELILDFGINIVMPKPGSNGNTPDTQQMHFKIDNRLVMNYHTAKRLAGALVQVVKAHEDRFGEIK
ncbi:MAG: DUF3467 domain-containing protein [Planctomycetota bacterium]